MAKSTDRMAEQLDRRVDRIDLLEEGWTWTDLVSMPWRELKHLAQECGHHVPAGATKAEMVALLLGEVEEIAPRPPSPEEMIRTAMQYRQWVRGVPPAHACLNAADKFYLDNLWRALDPVWNFTE